MKLTIEEKNELEQIYQEFLNNEKILKMKEIPMHRGSNCYEHSFKVAKLAIHRGLRHKNVNLKAILVASILHDYYLYDWRKDDLKKKGHGNKHPYIAANNAKDDFGVDEQVAKIIKSHMWPLNIKEFPNSTEARIVSLADKHVATVEFSSSKKYKENKREKYLNNISSLFAK